ncbi:thioredoxin superfamily protein [Wolffia australiana]
MDAASATGVIKKQHPLPWLDMLIREPFYLFHLLAFFTYFAARSSAVEIQSSNEHHLSLLRREIQAVLAFLVLAVVKAVKSETLEAYLADLLFYGKVFLFALALLIDQNVAIYYLIGFLVIFAVAQQPACDKLGDSCKLTPLQLETLLTEAGASRFWLVEFRSQISSRCIRLSRLLPELSVTYSNKNISFGIIDLGHFPNCAEKFGISLEGALGGGQRLPIYILFEHGVEVARLPQRGHDSSILSKKVLCRHFGLDYRLIEYIAG